MTYHSAMKDELNIKQELDEYSADGNLVFCADVVNNLGDILARLSNIAVDLIYSEPSWRRGYDIFLERAGGKPSEYNDYLESINEIIATLNVPTVLVMGKHMLHKVRPTQVIELKKGLNGGDCIVGLWSVSVPAIIEDTDELLSYLARMFDSVYDFSCGYGNTARVFGEHGKRFVCSDINKKCVYYVARNYMGWGE